MNKIYQSLCLFTNFFLPVMQLTHKIRQGAKVTRSYDIPCSPYERVLASPCITDKAKGASTSVLTLSLFMRGFWRTNSAYKTWFLPEKRTNPTSFRGKAWTGNFTRFQVDLLMRQQVPNHEFERTCNRLGIKHTTTKTKHPWTNGDGERPQPSKMNSTLLPSERSDMSVLKSQN
jgi:hypothetical protein